MTGLAVRVAGPGDAGVVAAILEASYPRLMAPAYKPELLARALPLMTRPHPRLLGSGRYYVCDLDGEPAGCGGWSVELPGGDAVEPGLAHIRHFAVRAGRTGRGVGRALYERCERDARAAGMHSFECWSSLNGEAFYATLGFVRIAPLDVPMGPGLMLPSIRMRRPI